mmetsp:Transcript_9814/g.24473  ORF Transcript_9814/g.24473 Transcript_9814/m.24473 type:complete len:133 (-) Transcript_9814:542-940(-)|eukprot:CAMPEP_0202865878 /NCGR_PEP_ID=MMETSP1391-20130828/6607_1 /ASSEMBLY_ACC=CAM_ASM_000867 /TAXON_ID=1034604 /ORGANISM="Chlamydomonas leiostraca, Strain SAG 11-49" /LENGTH=132 /DNA_ID=CAMNT_0049545763 /DNA_START=142 /DNA_END=540 /DNA_ORIENTATION=+
MSFVTEFIQGTWAARTRDYDSKDLKAWLDFTEQAEKDRQRERILGWKDRVSGDNYAVNAEEPEYYRRTAGFVWRIKDDSGKHKARNHQYLYNLEVYGHKQVSRRDTTELSKAQAAVASRVIAGDLGPLSPLD